MEALPTEVAPKLDRYRKLKDLGQPLLIHGTSLCPVPFLARFNTHLTQRRMRRGDVYLVAVMRLVQPVCAVVGGLNCDGL